MYPRPALILLLLTVVGLGTAQILLDPLTQQEYISNAMRCINQRGYCLLRSKTPDPNIHQDVFQDLHVLRDFRAEFFCNERLGSQCWLPINGVSQRTFLDLISRLQFRYRCPLHYKPAWTDFIFGI